jgi:hypothetical protein
MLKPESKDLLLVQLWHRDRAHPYDHVDVLVLLSFSYSGFTFILFCICAISLSPSVSCF